MRLIDADSIQEELAVLILYSAGTPDGECVEYAHNIIDAQPTIDAVPLVHARGAGIMNNAEWMIKNGYKFSDIHYVFSIDHKTCCFYLNGKIVGEVISKSYPEALKKWLDMDHDPILDEVEKMYLSAIIKPFRNRVDFICKVNFLEDAFQHIVIGIANDEAIALPLFESGTMYKGMKSGHGYTLEELGL